MLVLAVVLWAIRFALEFLRGDSGIRLGPMSLVQLVCLSGIATFAVQLREPRPAAVSDSV